MLRPPAWARLAVLAALPLALVSVEQTPTTAEMTSRLVRRARAPGWTLDPEAMKAGVVLGLFSQERGYDYGPKLREIRGLGAAWVELLLVDYQDSVTSTCVGPDPVKTPRLDEVGRVIREAHALGLRVLVLPIVILRQMGPKDWRGSLAPESLEVWLDSYRTGLLALTEVCEREGAEALSVGSELCSLEGNEELWRGLIAEVRTRYGGLLTYSANWDHYDVARYYDALDFVGVSAYFSLTRDKEPTVRALVAAWQPIVRELEAWKARVGKPVAFLEIGYPSVDGGAADPWNYVMDGPADPGEQALCYQALRQVFVGSPLLSGLFVYDWWEEGGPSDRTYTPRGKPAEAVLRTILDELTHRGANH
jgi:glycosyl hydrolase family 113